MESVPLKKAKEHAKSIEDTLRGDDPRLRESVVHMLEIDGSIIHYEDAFYEIHDEWVYIFSEHHPPYVQELGSILHVKQFKITQQHWGTE